MVKWIGLHNQQPHTQAVLLPSVPRPPAAKVRVTRAPLALFRATRLRGPAWSAASNSPHLVCRSQQLKSGQWDGVPCLSRIPQLRKAWGVLAHMENVHLGAHPGASHMADPARHGSLSIAKEGVGACPVPEPPTPWGIFQAGAVPFGSVGRPPFLTAPLPSCVWLSALCSPSNPSSTVPPPSLSSPSLLCYSPPPLTRPRPSPRARGYCTASFNEFAYRRAIEDTVLTPSSDENL